MRTILLVDDAPELREILDLVLSSQGWSVLQADSLAQAEEWLQREPLPDMIVLDFHLPDGEGLSRAQAWKAHPTWSVIPIVLYSGSEQPAAPCLAGTLLKTLDPFEVGRRLEVLWRQEGGAG